MQIKLKLLFGLCARTRLDSLDELCGVPFARPDSVDEIRLVDDTIHPIVCVVEVNKENQGTQHSSVFFSVQAMGCFGTLFKTFVGLEP